MTSGVLTWSCHCKPTQLVTDKRLFLKKIGDFAPTRPVDPKFQVEGVALHQPFFFSEIYAKWSFVWYKNLDRSFFRFVTMYAFDGQTDRQNSHR